MGGAIEELAAVAADKIREIEFTKLDFYIILIFAWATFLWSRSLRHKREMAKIRLNNEAEKRRFIETAKSKEGENG